jgi:hypothetical protein
MALKPRRRRRGTRNCELMAFKKRFDAGQAVIDFDDLPSEGIRGK